ncbi:Response regulator receiver modulated diguanylate cyclase [Candidatus Desulfosporosinus infrequens]|uniref:Stage 0 sporulation protein A homolog n=1 Tax=Candidatus Desulfosporosinus infrequens TaxID=2043169 RepID=A0A2U3LWS6_9FIRM|nr:Response regulator receiver modulated diguanylate cyclase [Candidatus Desulfosporosinus infrequens]
MSDGQIKVLIVVDKSDYLLVIKNILAPLDCKIITARSGTEALNYMRSCEFALVLLDIRVQEMDGLEIAERMRASERTKGIPIIFITANSVDQDSLFKGFEVGAVDYLLKPIKPNLLRSKVRVFLDLYLQKQLLKIQAELLESKVSELLELKKVNCHLESISSLDGLTGIPNRRTLDQYIGMSWKNALRERQPLSIIMADIDNFKSYNDNYGHLQGDECLIQVAKSLVSCIKRPNDLVARYGGEEFIALLPNTGKKGASIVAERMRECIEKLALQNSQSQVAHYVTISIGVAEIIPTPFDSIADFIKSADNALYMAKYAGRNIVHMGTHCQLKSNNRLLPKTSKSFREIVEGVWLAKRGQVKTILSQLLGA